MGHKIERIMLVNPPATISSPAFEGRACSPPLGLAYLAAVLEIEREVRILDCVLEGYNLQRQAESPKPLILPLERYFSLGRPHGAALARGKFATMITSRGCPARCIFCAIHSVWGKTYRARSAENVLAEIEHLIERYGVEEIFFEDDNLTFNRWRMEKICQGIIDRGWRIRWVAPNGVAL